MGNDRITLTATAIVLATGAFWGFYWIPVRALRDLGLAGAWGTAAIAAAAIVVLLPIAMARRRAFGRADLLAIASVALGGAAFALYSVALVDGRVAIVILLYFLTPIWSTLIGRYAMGWRTPRMRIVAIAVGLAGLVLMLGAGGDAPMPSGAGEWMALLAGILWSVGTTGIRARSTLRPVEAALVFAIGATVAAGLLAPALDPLPSAGTIADPARTLALALATGAAWWALSVAALLWATVRLEPARVGILLMSEVLVGAVSAAVLADEHLLGLEIAGGSLVLLAGVLEVWPVRGDRSATS